MEFPASIENLEEAEELERPLHLAIGVFDGVHLGHKAVIESAVLSARRSRGVSGVLTFDPHPSRLFRPENPTRLIMDVSTKTRMLHDVGVDLVICKHFDREFAAISAEDFLKHLKLKLPTLRSVFVGENFRFGSRRSGDVALMVETGQPLRIAVISADRIKYNGEPISSTRIRAELSEGAISSVNDLLGYTYFSTGVVVPGAQLGRQIGFPTLNIDWAPECRPCLGVYVVRFRELGSEDWVEGVANYGVKPTVAEKSSDPMLEVHSLTSADLGAGDRIEVEWLQFIRQEQKFESFDALVAQIKLDKAKAMDYFQNG